MSAQLEKITSFNRYPVQDCYRNSAAQLEQLFDLPSPIIARGLGRSYGDASLNANLHVVDLQLFNRLLEFNETTGILIAEAGASIKDILETFAPRGWFVPVVPGTQWVTLGGCIAADVHGKNHVSQGSFNTCVLWFELVIQKQIYFCSREQHAELFWATVGGLGLTGIISKVAIQLKKIANPQMTAFYQSSYSVEETLDQLIQNQHHEYKVSWMNALPGKTFGHGILMSAEHNTSGDENSLLITKKKKRLNIPCFAPSSLLNRFSIHLFNQLYLSRHRRKQSPVLMPYQSLLFPLDHVSNWNRLYGKHGFLQYQFVIPLEHAARIIKKIFQILFHHHFYPFLTVIKQFGDHPGGFLSFAQPGITVAFDLAFKNQALLTLLDQLDEIIIAEGGRVYLVKDARLKPENFFLMYPKANQWQNIKKQFDPENHYQSSLARRLQLI